MLKAEMLRTERRAPGWMRVGFWICEAIAIAVVLRRAAALLTGPKAGGPPQAALLDAVFASQAAVTWVHISCALVFVLLLPLLFWKRTRETPGLKYAILSSGFVLAATAYAMTRYNVGGWVERSAVLVFDSLFVWALLQSLLAGRRRDGAAQRRWVLRATAIVLGIATTRPVMGVFFATSRLTHLTMQQFFGVAFWVGFSINTVAMEIWLRRRGARA
jgi:hypothetical protein